MTGPVVGVVQYSLTNPPVINIQVLINPLSVPLGLPDAPLWTLSPDLNVVFLSFRSYWAYLVIQGFKTWMHFPTVTVMMEREDFLKYFDKTCYCFL